MMRSWENRPDTFVVDEPFYAHFLLMTKRPHPLAGQVVAHYETNWRKVVAWLAGDAPEGKAIFFQKRMTHHILPHMDRAWINDAANWFLIRHPREMLTSYLNKMPCATMADLGFPQQAEIFHQVQQHTGEVPPVVDSRDVLENPRRMLGLLCDALDVEFTDAMLSWPEGRRASDGIWGSHWYGQVERTTSFGPYRPKPDEVPPALEPLYQQCLEMYDELHDHRLGQ